jgi:hypothetical protein
MPFLICLRVEIEMSRKNAPVIDRTGCRFIRRFENEVRMIHRRDEVHAIAIPGDGLGRRRVVWLPTRRCNTTNSVTTFGFSRCGSTLSSDYVWVLFCNRVNGTEQNEHPFWLQVVARSD